MELSRTALDRYLLTETARTIARRPEGVPAPLSFSQEQVWVQGLLAAGLPLYHETVTISYSGALSTVRLRTCLNTIAMHHELWHTSIQEIEGVPQLVALPAVQIPVEDVDLSHLSELVADREKKRLTHDLARRPFDLHKGPLLRALVIKLGQDRSEMYLNLHHLIFDGVSLRHIFLQQLAELYSGSGQRDIETLAPQEVHFADFSYWQRRQTLTEDHPSREYWKARLTSLTAFRLPTDHPRTKDTTCRGKVQPLVFAPGSHAAVQEFARQESTTIFNVMLASFAVLLARYANQSAVVIGSTYGGRTHLELETVMGYFLNLVAFEIDLGGEPNFRELLARVRDVSLSAMTHATVDVQSLARELSQGRAVGESLVQVIFTFQPDLRDLPPEWDLDVFSISNGTAKFDLHIELEAKRDSFVGRVIYNTDLFDDETIAGLVDRWPILLEAALRAPREPVWQLPVLSSSLQAWLVNELNPNPSDFPAAAVHELFHRQAISTPHRIAVAGRKASLTYRDLDRRSTAFAEHLRSLGCGPGSVIGVMLERTPDLLTALLGILKSGAAYLPVDLNYPAARLHQMLSASNADLLITQPHLVPRLPPNHPRLLLEIESASRSVGDSRSEEARDYNVSLDETAYLIFTSGSTGEPKGVEISHRALTNLLWSMRQEPGIEREDVLLAVTSISFDIAALELFLPLLAGGRVELATTAEAADPELLLSRMQSSGTTILQATPATWRSLIESGWTGNSSLKALCGGERLTENLAGQLVARAASVWNMYGPTESTIWSSCSRVSAASSAIVLGAPIANTSFFVLDPRQKLVPAGIAGELYIGGVGLARGYWKNPAMTAEKFPLLSIEGGPPRRLYRTGDRVRRLPDGSLVFIGRVDNQIKLRGFRIELGEIETILNQLPTVQESVVVKHQQPTGDEILVAYVVPAAGEPPDRMALQRELERRLPAYMQPSWICVLNEVPLTPNGKLDRNRLPDPDVHQSRTLTEAPLPGVEQELATLWREMLGIDYVGRHESFFDLGGHSLMGARFIARANRSFGGPFSLVALVQAPTIALFADVVRNGSTPQVSSLQQGTAAAENLFWCGAEPWLLRMSRHLRQRVTLKTLTLNARSLQSLEPDYTMEAMASRMVEQITTLQPDGPYLLGGFCLFALLAYETAKQLQARGLAVSLLILGDAYPPGRSPHFTLSENVTGRVLREYNSLLTVLRSSPLGWRHYLRRRIFDLRGLAEYTRWKKRGRSRHAKKYLPEELSQALIMAELVYQIEPYSGRVLFLQAGGDPNLLHKHTAPTWDGLIENPALFTYPGGHMNILEEPHLSVAARYIRDEIDNAAVGEAPFVQSSQ